MVKKNGFEHCRHEVMLNQVITRFLSFQIEESTRSDCIINHMSNNYT